MQSLDWKFSQVFGECNVGEEVQEDSDFHLDNRKLGALRNKKDAAPVMQLYTRDSSKSWKQVESNGPNRLTIKEPSANIVLLDFISSEIWNDVVNFDDHLDDISKDWLNSGLFK
ncbi:putative ER membrane protein complex subunit [Helianthus anomalus]